MSSHSGQCHGGVTVMPRCSLRISNSSPFLLLACVLYQSIQAQRETLPGV